MLLIACVLIFHTYVVSNFLPAMSFTPTQNHKIKFAVAFIDEIPGIPEQTNHDIVLFI